MIKKSLKFILLLGMTLMIISSCAFHNGYIYNSVSLNQPNFSYIKTNISGEASTTHFLGIGGLERQAIVAEAKQKMLAENPLKQNQSLANVTIDWKTEFYFVVIKKTCTVTADIVEFNKTGFVEEKSPSKTGEVKNNKPFKVGDKVIFKDAFKSITGVISNIDGEYYFIAYQNKKGVDKILKTYETTFITKIE